MKIAIFSDCYLDLTGGIVTVINSDKAALESLGHTVYVFSSSFPKTESEKQKLAKKHIYPVKSCQIFGRGITPIARRPRVIEKELEKDFPELKDFDIFYVHYEAGCSIAGLRFAKKYHIPSVQVMHGREDVGEEKLIPFGFRTIVAAALNMFHSWYLPHQNKIYHDNYLADTIAKAKMWTLMVNHANYADFILTPSEHFRQKLLFYGVNKPITALAHGINDAVVARKVTPKALRSGAPLEMIWHSRVSGEKRIMSFLAALKELPRDQYHLSVFGDGPDLIKAKAFVKKNNLNVKFFGNADFEKIWQTLQKSHLDVLVSYNYDTFGMTLLEATAAGVPALIVDPDMQEILPKGGYVLADGPSPHDMAEAIKRIIKDPEIIQKMSLVQIGARSEKKSSLKIEKLEKIFKKLL